MKNNLRVNEISNNLNNSENSGDVGEKKVIVILRGGSDFLKETGTEKKGYANVFPKSEILNYNYKKAFDRGEYGFFVDNFFENITKEDIEQGYKIITFKDSCELIKSTKGLINNDNNHIRTSIKNNSIILFPFELDKLHTEEHIEEMLERNSNSFNKLFKNGTYTQVNTLNDLFNDSIMEYRTLYNEIKGLTNCIKYLQDTINHQNFNFNINGIKSCFEMILERQTAIEKTYVVYQIVYDFYKDILTKINDKDALNALNMSQYNDKYFIETQSKLTDWFEKAEEYQKDNALIKKIDNKLIEQYFDNSYKNYIILNKDKCVIHFNDFTYIGKHTSPINIVKEMYEVNKKIMGKNLRQEITSTQKITHKKTIAKFRNPK